MLTVFYNNIIIYINSFAYLQIVFYGNICILFLYTNIVGCCVLMFSNMDVRSCCYLLCGVNGHIILFDFDYLF